MTNWEGQASGSGYDCIAPLTADRGRGVDQRISVARPYWIRTAPSIVAFGAILTRVLTPALGTNKARLLRLHTRARLAPPTDRHQRHRSRWHRTFTPRNTITPARPFAPVPSHLGITGHALSPIASLQPSARVPVLQTPSPGCSITAKAGHDAGIEGGQPALGGRALACRCGPRGERRRPGGLAQGHPEHRARRLLLSRARGILFTDEDLSILDTWFANESDEASPPCPDCAHRP